MSNKILVVAAHPDDEVLGCGGTIIKHIKNGDLVEIILMSDGVGSRAENSVANLQDREERHKMAERASALMGVHKLSLFDFPDNMMDAVPLLDIVRKLEPYIRTLQPSIIYTHYKGDLNIDHQITYRSVMTACRPLSNSTISKIYSFEVLSSTEWTLESTFAPTHFVDIHEELPLKMEVLEIYGKEMRCFPNSRSTQAVELLAKLRGASMGLPASEAFTVERSLE